MIAHQWTEARIRRSPGQRPARLVMVNRKGGSGKTTTTVQLAAVFAAWGARVRITDGDPQLASATYWLPPQREAPYPTLLDVFMDDSTTLADITAPTRIPNVLIAPSLHTLGQVELNRPPGTDTLLQVQYARSAEDWPADRLGDPPDIELLDAPGAVGTVTVSMLAAASSVLITQQASTLDRVGNAEFSQTLSLVRQRLNPELSIAGVVLVAANRRAELTKTLRAQLRQQYPDARVWTVPYNVRVREAPSVHQSLIEYAPSNPATEAYWQMGADLVPELGFEWVVKPAQELREQNQENQQADQVEVS